MSIEQMPGADGSNPEGRFDYKVGWLYKLANGDVRRCSSVKYGEGYLRSIKQPPGPSGHYASNGYLNGRLGIFDRANGKFVVKEIAP